MADALRGSVVITLVALCTSACGSSQTSPAPEASASSASSAAATAPSAAPKSTAAATTRAAPRPPAIMAVEPANAAVSGADAHPFTPYPAGPVDPIAQRFCDAVMRLPAQRASACCATTDTVGASFATSCAENLSGALRAHTVALTAADTALCAAAQRAATSGCDWVTPAGATVASACKGIVKGLLAEGASCRSSLECPVGMACQGLGSIYEGRCGPPLRENSPCSAGTDTLQTWTRQDVEDTDHPTCTGDCAKRRCATPVEGGAACTASRQCASKRCAAGKCVARVPTLGDACTDACAPGIACVKGKCTAPKASGASCESDGECRGACVRADGGPGGTCAMTCPTPR